MKRTSVFLLICLIIVGAYFLAAFNPLTDPGSSAEKHEENGRADNGENNVYKGDEEENVQPGVSCLPGETFYRRAVLAAVGDIMVHRTQFVRAYDPQEDSYDFDPSFAVIAPYLQEADVVVGNLETTLGGQERGFSAYPRFNSPDEIVWALRGAGFDLLSTANNHCLDTGEKGLYRTIEMVEKAGMRHFGTFRSEEERNAPLIVEVNGIYLAFLSYTYGTNGLPVPAGREYIVNLLDEEKMASDIDRAREEGADLVILYLHWGEEYRSQPTEGQKNLARAAAEAGADIILGSHPHVIQPMAYIPVTGAEGEEKKVFVAYSLGNFLSNQHRIAESIPTDDVEYGKILYLYLEKDESTGNAYLREVDYRLTWVQRSRGHRILPLDRILEDPAGEFELTPAVAGRLEKDDGRLQARLEGFRRAGAEAVPEAVPVGP